MNQSDGVPASLDTLRPLAAVAAALMTGFLLYNLVDFPPGVRAPMVAHDAACIIVSASIWWVIRAGKMREESAHGAATLLILLIASNVLLSMWLLRNPYYTIYIDVLLVGAGVGMTSPRWAAFVFAALWLLTIPVLRAVADTTLLARYAATMGATTGVAAALFTLRVRNLRALADLRAHERAQRKELKEALADLDAKVALRTAELQAANEALHAEMDERALAEEDARRLSEQLLHAQRLESLGRLAGGVAHDFNNLLTVIEGNLRFVLDDLPPGADKAPLEDAIGASQRAANLTKQLLAFGRKQRAERAVLDLGKKIEDDARMLERVLGEEIALHISTGDGGLLIDADANQIEQVLMNLAANARDAMLRGGALHLDVERIRARDAAFVRLRVVDTGVGMDAAVVDKLFEPFFTTKERGKGTGLGLSTVYGIVQQHRGFIEVESSPGKGSRFDVFFPAVEGAAGVPTDVPGLVAGTNGTETVLLVEDEDAVRRVAERFLRRHGYNVLAASSGDEAIGIAAKLGRPLDLLFTDVMMPGMNGAELAEKLRRAQPGLKVLFVSGYTGDYLLTHTGELPTGTHFLYKPYEPAQAARLIRDVLDGVAVSEQASGGSR